MEIEELRDRIREWKAAQQSGAPMEVEETAAEWDDGEGAAADVAAAYAEEVAAEVRNDDIRIDLATVYRTLELLVDNGLATRLDLGAGHTAYATGEHGPHVQLVCRHCGRILEVEKTDIPMMFESIQRNYSFDCRPYHFSIHGICSDCMAQAD